MKTIKDILFEVMRESNRDFQTLEEVEAKVEAKIYELSLINRVMIRINTFVGGLLIRYKGFNRR